MPGPSEPTGHIPLPSSWPKALSSLESPGFRLLLLGQAVALQGTWIQGTAQRWLVLELSNSPFILGVFGAVAGLPILLFSYWGGWLADRMDRISVLYMAQGLIVIQAILFGLLVHTGIINVVEATALAFALGTGMAFEVPARQALVFDLVGRENITNALALHSTAFNTARFAGPAIAGLLMDVGVLFACFYLKAASSLFILVILFILKGRFLYQSDSHRSTQIDRDHQKGFKHTLVEVLVFAKEDPTLRWVLIVVLFFGVCLLPYTILLPSFGRDLLGLGAREYGFLCAANGLGALVGALFVATFGHKGQRRTWWRVGVLCFPVCILLFSQSRSYLQGCITLFAAGLSMVIANTSSISLLQLCAKDSLRGRIMGLFTTSFMGLFPAGSLIQGTMGQWIGVRTTLFAMALIALIAGIWGAKSLSE